MHKAYLRTAVALLLAVLYTALIVACESSTGAPAPTPDATADAAGTTIAQALTAATAPATAPTVAATIAPTAAPATATAAPSANPTPTPVAPRIDLGVLAQTLVGEVPLHGTGEPDSTVFVYLDGAIAATAPVNAGGAWAVLLAPVAPGEHVLTAAASDAANAAQSAPVRVVVQARPTVTHTPTPTDIPSRTPTRVSSRTPTPSSTPTPDVSATVAIEAIRAADAATQVTASAIPTNTPTRKPTVTPTRKPTATPTRRLTATPTRKPTATPTRRPTATPIRRPTTTPTRRPTVTPTRRPTATPTRRPTATPTWKPTATQTRRPTATPTRRPTATPTRRPTTTPTRRPTATPIRSALYVEIASATGDIRVDVPVDWTDVDSGPWEIDGEPFGNYLTAAPNLADYESYWGVPGVWLWLTDQFDLLDLNEMLDTFTLAAECTRDARYNFEGERLAGVYDLWTKCGGDAANQAATFALHPLGNDELALIGSMAFNADSGAVLDRILRTLAVSGTADSRSNTDDDMGKTAEVSSAAGGEIYVTINAAKLNIRSGPDTNYERIATINQGATLLAIGQYDGCAWLRIEDGGGLQGWVSGDAQYTTLEGNCASLPKVAAPPVPAAGSGGQAGDQTGAQSGAQAGASNSRQGCINFTNNAGEDLTITFTRKGDNWNTAFQLNKGQAKEQCVDPGSYALTVSTVFGGSLNQDIEIAAGDRIDFPLSY